MYKKILVATDGSEGAKKATAVAIALAALAQAELYALAVEEDLPKYAATIDEVEEVKAQRNGFFAQIMNEVKTMAAEQNLTVHTEVRPGHEVETIIHYIQEQGIDLLVIGFMGHSALFGRVWGSTSQNLTRLAPCSVLVVK